MRQVDEKWNHLADESAFDKCSPLEEVMRTTSRKSANLVVMWIWIAALGYFVALLAKAIEQVWRDL